MGWPEAEHLVGWAIQSQREARPVTDQLVRHPLFSSDMGQPLDDWVAAEKTATEFLFLEGEEAAEGPSTPPLVPHAAPPQQSCAVS